MSKFKVGDEISINGTAKITGVQISKRGHVTYQLSLGGSLSEIALSSLHTSAVEQPEQPKQEDKPNVKVGDMVKCLGNHHAENEDFYPALGTIGMIVGTDGDERQTYKIKWASGSTSLSDTWWAYNDDIEPYAEPKQEPVKLYCVKTSDVPWVREALTKGNVYEFDGHYIEYDSGTSARFEDFESWKRGDPNYAVCLAPLVSRTAQVGEWVYIENTGNRWDGMVGKVIGLTNDGRPKIEHDKVWFDYGNGKETTVPGKSGDILVLDGYKPEPEKAEPEYLNMKVVCVKLNRGVCHTVGKVYEIKDGFLTSDNSNRYNTRPYRTLESLNEDATPDFIEFKGE